MHLAIMQNQSKLKCPLMINKPISYKRIMTTYYIFYRFRTVVLIFSGGKLRKRKMYIVVLQKTKTIVMTIKLSTFDNTDSVSLHTSKSN